MFPWWRENVGPGRETCLSRRSLPTLPCLLLFYVPFFPTCHVHHYSHQNFDQVGCYECKCTIGELEFIAEGHTKPDAKVQYWFGWKAKILIPRFTLLSWQFKDSSLRSESVNECLNHGYSKMFLRCELNETEGVGNRLRASNSFYEKRLICSFCVFLLL